MFFFRPYYTGGNFGLQVQYMAHGPFIRVFTVFDRATASIGQTVNTYGSQKHPETSARLGLENAKLF